MGIKSVLVHVDAGPGCNRRLQLAKSIAARFGASLIGLGAEACEVAAAMGDATLVDIAREGIARELQAAEVHFREATKDCAAVGWLKEETYPDRALARHARAADLIVTSRPVRGESAAYAPRLSDLVMEAGVPVLVAADGASEFSGRSIVVAWKDTRESRRALHDALPFLKRASSVVIVAVGGEGDSTSCAHSDDLVEVTRQLARHGVNAGMEIAPKGPASVTEAIEDAAGRHGADLIVAGAYGRSRLSEWWLGGVTEDLVMSSSKFALLSH